MIFIRITEGYPSRYCGRNHRVASDQQYRTYDPCGRVHQTECIRGIYGIFPGGDPAWRDPGSCCTVLEQAVALLHKKNPEKTQMALRKQSAVPRTVLTFVEKYCDKDKWILWFKILVACLPTIIIALPFNDIIEEKFYNYVVVAIMLIVYGVLFIVIENYNNAADQPAPDWMSFPLRQR